MSQGSAARALKKFSDNLGGGIVLRITLTKSTNRAKEKQVATVQALGLRKIRSFVEQNDTPQIRGMIKRVNHMVKVEEI
jgi:large subunit ribosomal protein L30